jgi:hypothetical protein
VLSYFGLRDALSDVSVSSVVKSEPYRCDGWPYAIWVDFSTAIPDEHLSSWLTQTPRTAAIPRVGSCVFVNAFRGSSMIILKIRTDTEKGENELCFDRCSAQPGPHGVENAPCVLWLWSRCLMSCLCDAKRGSTFLSQEYVTRLILASLNRLVARWNTVWCEQE